MRAHLITRLPLKTLLLLGVAGCGGERGSMVPAPTVSDSAGIRVVTNRIPRSGIPTYATVAPNPDLELRQTAGEDQQPFRLVVGVRTGPDGTIAIADAANRLVSFHTAEGQPLGVVRGGPRAYRFRDLTRLGRAEGGFWVFDAAALRLTRLEGPQAVEVTDVPPLGDVVGRFGDGSFLIRPRWSLARHRAAPVGGIRRDTAAWHRWWPATGDTAAVGLFPFDETVVAETDTVDWFGLPPFGRATSVEVGPGRWYVGDQVQFEIRGLDPDGTLREVVRLAGLDLTLTPELVQAAKPTHGADGGPLEAWMERFWEAVPPTRPAYTTFLLDGMGSLWVAEHVARDDPPRNWMVFDAAGAVRGLVEVPPGFVLWEAGTRHLLGVGVDPEGGAVVRRYPLTREP
jgi:hypothetical protein